MSHSPPRSPGFALSMLGLVGLCLVFSLVVWPSLAARGLRTSGDTGGSAPTRLVIRTSHVVIEADDGSLQTLAGRIAARLEWLRPRINRDFDTRTGILTVRLFRTHGSLSHMLWKIQRQRPQTQNDNTSAIVNSMLLLGPSPASYLWHNLAHVYAEWTMDRLTGNRGDALPPNTWLYDGLAEYEAYRYVPQGLRCTGSASSEFDVTSVRSPRQWLQLRSGPLSALEYCLAYVRVRELVERFSWTCFIHALHQTNVWVRLPQWLERLPLNLHFQRQMCEAGRAVHEQLQTPVSSHAQVS